MNEQSYTSSSITRSPAAIALDDLVRRQLRVSDPRDAVAVSRALRERYGAQDHALRLEAAGMPFRLAPVDVQQPVRTSVSGELLQAQDDVLRDIDSLLGDALLKDVHPELRGWAQNIRQAVATGTQAARFALDPWQRDQAMGTRRLLGDYARVARFVGALTSGATRSYRALAHSLDEVSSVILITMGEAVAQSGVGGGRFLLQAPSSELQVRRDAVLSSLRTLVGSRQALLGQGDWGYGLQALRGVLGFLDQSGMTDLRALFQETYVGRALDELVQWATRGSAEDLRALGATAQLSLGRFRRLLIVAGDVVEPQSPPLTTYFDAIRAFIDAFGTSAGYRLPFVGRPAIAHHGLYGFGGPDRATQRLLDIIGLRGELARLLDCHGCSCTPGDIWYQIRLDKVLYDVDRAIDLYVMGNDPEGQGQPEQRAAAYGVIIQALLHQQASPSRLAAAPPERAALESPALLQALQNLQNLLYEAADADSGVDTLAQFSKCALDLMHQELCVQLDAERQWESMLHTLAPSCFTGGVTGNGAAMAIDIGDTGGVLHPTLDLFEYALNLINDAIADDMDPRPVVTIDTASTIPPHGYTGIAMLAGSQDQRGRPQTVGTAQAVINAATKLGNGKYGNGKRGAVGRQRRDALDINGDWCCDLVVQSANDVEVLRSTGADRFASGTSHIELSPAFDQSAQPVDFPVTLLTCVVQSADEVQRLKRIVMEINQQSNSTLLLTQRRGDRRPLTADDSGSTRPPPAKPGPTSDDSQ